MDVWGGLSTTPAISPETPGDTRGGNGGVRPVLMAGVLERKVLFAEAEAEADRGFFHSAWTGNGSRV